MKPSRIQIPTRYVVRPCSLGFILVSLSSTGLFAIQLGDNPVLLQENFQQHYPQAILDPRDPAVEQAAIQILALLENAKLSVNIPLDAGGTAFQQRVWQALREIPAGETASYSDIAQRIGKPKAIRAVANACAANPLAILIPCHRVVKRNGDLSGYRWGIARKVELLKREQSFNYPTA